MNSLQQKISSIIRANSDSRNDVALDYFSWGRDERHVVDNTEKMPPIKTAKSKFKDLLRPFYRYLFRDKVGHIESYSKFNDSYLLMSDDYSKNLFAELLAMQLLGERNMQLSSFTNDLIASYENASSQILLAQESLAVYKWILKKVDLKDPSISFYTSPEALNLANSGRLYRYEKGEVLIDVEPGDVVIDAGVGWGDTVVYLASKALSEFDSKYYAFDIVQEGLSALERQLDLNPHISNVIPVLKALSNCDGEVCISEESSPGSRVEIASTSRSVPAITIDSFAREEKCKKIDFIKMDIEGSEVPALIGAQEVIKKYKPKLAISVYHKWDDLQIIPMMIHNIRPDYQFYLDCTTGFGGEAVLYCK